MVAGEGAVKGLRTYASTYGRPATCLHHRGGPHLAEGNHPHKLPLIGS